MAGLVKLNQRSQQLINDYLVAKGVPVNYFTIHLKNLDAAHLVSWLSQEESLPEHMSRQSKQELEFIIASLRAELLRDLLTAFSNNKTTIVKEESSWSDKVKFIFLTLAGTLVAASEGFDSTITLLSVLSVPAIVILITGLVFSLLSIVVFYGFDLVQVSRNLGVKIKDAPQIMDIYLAQMSEIKAIRRTIDTFYLSELSNDELLHLEHTMVMLEQRFKSLVTASKQFADALQSTKLKAAKIIVTGVGGLLFFGSGFFAGQSLGMFIASLIFTAVTPTFWPVILFSAIVGIAAFSVYWYVEQIGLKQLIGGWFGLEEDKVSTLCNVTLLQKEEYKLQNLKEKIKRSARVNQQLARLKQEPDSLNMHPRASLLVNSDPTKVSENRYVFHCPPADPGQGRVSDTAVQVSHIP